MSSKANDIRALLCALSMLAASCTAATGEIIYVDVDAVAEFDGSSWIFAYRNLQDAISSARPGDEIRVAHGTYRPDLRTSPGGRAGGRGTITASADRTAPGILTMKVIRYRDTGEPYLDGIGPGDFYLPANAVR